MDLDLVEELTRIPAPAGFEVPAARFVYRHLRAFASHVTVDALGNVLARVTPERSGKPRVMLFAHLDEVGFMVRRVEPTGLLRVARIGGIPEKSMSGQLVRALGQRGDLPGVIGTRSHHLTPPELKYQVVPVDQVYVDLGLGSAAEVEAAGVVVGTPVVWERHFSRRGRRIFANALDDRAGLAALLGAGAAIAKAPPSEAEVWIVATVQEEWSLQGAVPAVRAVEPDMAIGVDISPACDTPELAGQSDVALGQGPVISAFTFHGRGMLLGLIPDPALSAVAFAAAERSAVPVQRGVLFGGLTDGSFVQYQGRGIPSLDLALATRYTHAPVESCDIGDLEGLERLLVELPARWAQSPDRSRADLVRAGVDAR